ncbi:MAG TPA: YciI family protein [Actinophytocola sp.]|nr:YciI family protein [Actinophytocola sp.]
MRFMVMIKGNPDSEAGVMPSEEQLAAMSAYNEELVKAGVMLDGDGLHPSVNGAIVKFSGGRPTVIDGPFTEAKELVAGYWVLEVKSREEAIEWVKRVPSDPAEGEYEIEIRRMYEGEELGEGYTEDIRERTEAMQAKVREQQG